MKRLNKEYIQIFTGLTVYDRPERLHKIRRTSFFSVASLLMVLASMVTVVPQAHAQLETVSGGSFLGDLQSTDFDDQTGTLQLFDSDLGILTGIEITYSGFGETVINVSNLAGSGSSANGSVATSLNMFYTSTNPDIDEVILTTPNVNTAPTSYYDWEAPLEITFSYPISNLEPGESVSSGTLTQNVEDNTESFSPSSGDFGAFQNAGGGTFEVTCFSGTYLNTALTGGNNESDQVTSAGCGMEITYTYLPSPTNITITEGPCWRTISSPEEQSYADFFGAFETGGTNYGGLWTQGSGITGARSSTGGANVFTLNSDGTDWTPVTNLNATMPAGTGVLISVFEQDEFENASSAGFPKVADFGDISSPTNLTLGTPNGTTSAGAGFSMLGNPFNTAIDFNLLYENATGIQQAAWVYDRNADGGSGGWVSTNDAGLGDLTDGIIAAGQGFVVQNTAIPGTPSVDFQDPVKIPKTGTFYGKKADKPDHLRIEVRGENVYNSAWVQLSNNGSIAEITSSDVVQFYPFEEDYAVLSTVKQGEMMDIGHFPYPSEQVSIPLSIETTSNKPMTLSLTDLKIGVTAPLYLHDTVTGESIELTEGAEYTFTPNGAPAKAIVGCLTAPTGLTRPAGVNKNTGPRFLINTQASINSGSEQPSAYDLQQNYPNPFNPTTQITYQLPQQSEVTLSVYDMAGRHVSTLVNESVNAGTHTVDFDGSRLSSGVYMYRLHAGSTVLTRKLTLIK
ncbi:choice-of-anchor E domain-containing protein [Rhodohalobacter sp. 614A]|uniref:choice-of-anchor E domain-containing protein n=1 Tax=Rhodohalobacter sp. 614A TaxID=2908649 RepID=UPI001F16B967|nr:choice-of-anchor E domain-containing protein [Rhodohalobacter sp. 614A]